MPRPVDRARVADESAGTLGDRVAWRRAEPGVAADAGAALAVAVALTRARADPSAEAPLVARASLRAGAIQGRAADAHHVLGVAGGEPRLVAASEVEATTDATGPARLALGASRDATARVGLVAKAEP